MTPIIAYLEEDVYDFEKCTPSEDEVDQIFTVSLETLLSPGYRKTEIFSRNDSSTYAFPYYGVKGDVQCIWGLTGLVLDAFLREAVVYDQNMSWHG